MKAAACATPIISDWWEGLDSFFSIGKEIPIAEDTEAVLRYLHDTPEEERRAIGDASRKRIPAEHTALHRAAQIEDYLREMSGGRFSRKIPRPQGIRIDGGRRVRVSEVAS